MKKFILLFICAFLFANENFINPFETNQSYQPSKSVKTNDANISTIILQTNTKNNQQKETNNTQNITKTEFFKDSFKTITPNIKIAVVIDKKFFKKYLPSIINSLNAYFLYKNVNYTIKVFDENNLTEALNYKNIIFYAIDPNITNSLITFSNNFYLPIINKQETNTTAENIFFGGINYKNQIKKLAALITKNSPIKIINSDTYISQKLYNIEKKEFNASVMKYPNINYYKLRNSYIFFNTSASKTGEILSNINYKNINTNLQFSAQINYDPLLIEITQPQDVQKLIIANSITNVPPILEDYNQLLNTDIEFNWLNYSANLLANKIYNQTTNSGIYYLNDFKLYMFANQVNYKTKLYQIIDNSFREIY